MDELCINAREKNIGLVDTQQEQRNQSVFQMSWQPVLIGWEFHIDTWSMLFIVDWTIGCDAKNNPSTIRFTYQQRSTGIATLSSANSQNRIDQSQSNRSFYHCVRPSIIITCTDLRLRIENILIGFLTNLRIEDANISWSEERTEWWTAVEELCFTLFQCQTIDHVG